MNNHATNKSGEEKPGKKAYRIPQFEVYGNIRDITRSVAGSGTADGGGAPPTNKT
jgi:hypothetical protein